MMGQAHQTPCATNLPQPPEQEATKTPRCFALSKHGFHHDLAPGVQRTARRRAHCRRHPLLRCGGGGGRPPRRGAGRGGAPGARRGRRPTPPVPAPPPTPPTPPTTPPPGPPCPPPPRSPPRTAP